VCAVKFGIPPSRPPTDMTAWLCWYAEKGEAWAELWTRLDLPIAKVQPRMFHRRVQPPTDTVETFVGKFGVCQDALAGRLLFSRTFDECIHETATVAVAFHSNVPRLYLGRP
jgi:hypothetical protein